MPTPSVNIPTPLPHGTTETLSAKLEDRALRGILSTLSRSRATALLLSFCLALGGASDVFSQAPHSKRKKSKKPKSAACQTGCKPDTAAPQITAATPEDAAAQRELVDIARGLHTAVPGAYDKLSAFATKHTGTAIGGRAALALGYDDYSKNRPAQALAWFEKAKFDTTLMEYVLYWSAMTKRLQHRTADAYIDLQTIQHDYPSTAMRELFLEAYAPAAVELGHTQEAIETLNAYSATNSRPALLFERAHAYQAAHQFPRAAKDYQTLYYKYPLSDEAKAAGSALPSIMHILGKEYSYPGVEMQDQRAQAFYDAHKWKEARAEYEKLLAMVKDPSNATRQRAQLRVAQARIQLKGSSSLLSSPKTPDPEYRPWPDRGPDNPACTALDPERSASR